MRRLALTATLAALAITGSTGDAAAAGRVTTTATTVYAKKIAIPANTYYSFVVMTDNLSGSEDPVLHVFDEPTGVQIASNDDCPVTAGYPNYLGAPGSCIYMNPSIANRVVWVVVRARILTAAGDATLRHGWCTSSCAYSNYWNYNWTWEWIWRFAGTAIITNQTLDQADRIFTVRQMPYTGANDTLVIAEQGTSNTAAVLADDEAGIRAVPENLTFGTSDVRLGTITCFSCRLFVGTHPAMPEGAVKVYWDDQLSQAGADPDSDGLSNSLEAVIGTTSTVSDTDADGLKDGEEVFGVVSGDLQFGYWGANPLHKDVFVEVDWQKTDPMNPDQFRPTRSFINSLINAFRDEDAANKAGNIQAADGVLGGISIHVDDGRGGADNDGTRAGRWSVDKAAALALPEAPQTACEVGLDSTRLHYFHHLYAVPSGGSGSQNAHCVSAQYNSTATVVHEFGHNFGPDHSGAVGAVANCKPHYQSRMNYLVEFDAGATFSDGRYSDSPLNPMSLDETKGLNFRTGSQIAFLRDKYGFKIEESTGKVDWNRDGEFSTSARGTPNLVTKSDCEIGMPHLRRLGDTTNISQGFFGRIGDSFYVSTINTSGGARQLQFRTGSARTDLCTGQNSWGTACPSSFSAASNVPNSVAIEGYGVAQQFVDTYNPTLPNADTMMVVYKDYATGRLVSQRLFIDGSGSPNWSAALPIDSTRLTYAGVRTDYEPTVVRLGNTVTLFAPLSDGTLLEYRFNLSSRVWDYIDSLRWESSGAAIVTDVTGSGLGMGATVATDPDGTIAVYGVFRRASDGTAEMIRRNPSSNRWVALTDAWNLRGGAGPSVNAGIPRIGYIPYNPGTPSNGRFYLAYKNVLNRTFIVPTEGNGPVTATDPRRRTFVNVDGALLNNFGANPTSGITLLSEPDGLRGAMVQRLLQPDGSTLDQYWFIPFFDGVYSASFEDYSDFDIMKTYVSCSIKGGC